MNNDDDYQFPPTKITKAPSPDAPDFNRMPKINVTFEENIGSDDEDKMRVPLYPKNKMFIKQSSKLSEGMQNINMFSKTLTAKKESTEINGASTTKFTKNTSLLNNLKHNSGVFNDTLSEKKLISGPSLEERRGTSREASNDGETQK